MLNNSYVRRAMLLIMDAGLVLCSVMIALLLRFEGVVSSGDWVRAMRAAPWLAACYLTANILSGSYQVLWRYASGRDFIHMGLFDAVAVLATLLIDSALTQRLPFSVLVLTGAFSYGLFSVSRYAWRIIVLSHNEYLHREAEKAPLRRIMIVGAGSAGSWAVAQCREQRYGEPVAVVDDAPIKLGLRVQGVPVLGSTRDIPKIVEERHVEDIVIAIPSLKGKRLAEIATICASTHCRVTTITAPREISANGSLPQTMTMRRLNMADFLSRDEVKLDTDSISSYLKGQTILVTGGGGSIGSEICRQVMKYEPKRLIIFDIYENCAYELYYELRQKYGIDVPVTVLIGSVRDRARLDDVMERYHPNVVFHAAAHKHVPLMETSPAEAVKNNIFGTRNTLLSAAAHGVERFVILSTDKAVNPTNVMGATKRVTEMIIQTLGPKTKMRCMAVRFGNVLNSHGSIIPLFEEQIKNGGPVTVTDPNVTRYFMTIPEAAQLVLQAGGIAQDGAIYVLDMGEPVKILDLAKRLIRFYGYEPDQDIKINIIGLRPGEKLYEELLMDAEADHMSRTSHDLIFVAPPIHVDEPTFLRQLDELELLCQTNSPQVVRLLEETVDTFHSSRKEKAG